MIRPFTCVCMLLAGGSGLYLYQTKHRALLLDREIAHTIKQTEATRERITALRAEWALLNEPERLAELQAQHLGLKPLAPTQFVTLADLPARLPAPLPAGSVVLPEPEEVAAVPAPEPVRTAAIVRPGPVAAPIASPIASPAAVPVATPTPLAPPTPRPLRTAKPAEPATKPVAVAAASPAPTPAQAPAPTPAPVVAAVLSVRAVALAPPRLASKSPSAPAAYATLLAVAPGTVGESVLRASSLGTAHANALPPPTPYTGR